MVWYGMVWHGMAWYGMYVYIHMYIYMNLFIYLFGEPNIRNTPTCCIHTPVFFLALVSCKQFCGDIGASPFLAGENSMIFRSQDLINMERLAENHMGIPWNSAR